MSNRVKNISGKRFGRLVVLELSYTDKKKRRSYWKCVCDCGTEKIVLRTNLGNSANSCGCFQREESSKRFTTHGLSSHQLYDIWNGMINRCYNSKNKSYNDYGGRGINVCERWKDLAAFIEDMKERPEGFQLDRINPNGSYEPTNCRWALPKDGAKRTCNDEFSRGYSEGYRAALKNHK